MSLVIIQMSDMHIETKEDQILQRREEIVEACTNHIRENDTVVLLFTGDVAYSGLEDEYNIAWNFLRDIYDDISSKTNNRPLFIALPGNHDCDFSDNQDVRECLLSTFDSTNPDIKQTIYNQIVNVQDQFWNTYSKFFGYSIGNRVFQKYDIPLENGKKALIMAVNSAWDSKFHEKAGELFIPCNLLDDCNTRQYEAVIVAMHHPFEWLHPDNGNAFRVYLRQNADLLFVGHEHTLDGRMVKGENWNIQISNGAALQPTGKDEPNGFSIHTIDFDSETIEHVDLMYNITDKSYAVEKSNADEFCRNAVHNWMVNNAEWKDFLSDFGTLVHHFRLEQITLDDLYIWPRIVLIDNIHIDNSTVSVAMSEDECKENFLSDDISLIVGDSLTGKTALAKQLYKYYNSIGKKCLYCKGEDFSSHTIPNILQEIESAFIKQYSIDEITAFRELPIDDKVLLIDDFDNMQYKDSMKEQILMAIKNHYGSVILLVSDSISMLPFEFLIQSEQNLKLRSYRIRHMNRTLRRNLITKWYSLGDEYSIHDPEFDNRIDNASNTIDLVLGPTGNLVPSTPIHIISILQTIGSAGNATFGGSRYGYLYDNLVQQTLRKVACNDEGMLNVLIAALSYISYSMLINKKTYFSFDEIITCVDEYEKNMKIDVDSVKLLSLLQRSMILVQIENNIYRFRYPYLYYYFVGKHIANNIERSEMHDLIDHMSKKLYIEDYGNIMIFICHFTHNPYVLETVLVNSLYQLDDVPCFDLSRKDFLLDTATQQFFLPTQVGTEEHVNEQIQEDLMTRDLLEQDQNELEEHKLADIPEDEFIAELFSAMRTVDVLGQILRNYPGDIDGNTKLETIHAIDELSLKIMTAFNRCVSMTEQEYIPLLQERMKDDASLPIPSNKKNIDGLFQYMRVSGICYTIDKMTTALGSSILLPAIKEAYDEEKHISLLLSRLGVSLRHNDNPPSDMIIKTYKEWETSNQLLPAYVLKWMVAWYLRRKRCGVSLRDQLCQAFSLSKNSSIPIGN